MWPMTLEESGDSVCKVSLGGLFRGEFRPCQVKTSTTDIVNLACRGGWPEAIDLHASDAQLIAREYLRALRRDSIPRLGLSGDVAERLLFSLARNLGQSATYKTLLADMDDASASERVTEQTLVKYLDALRNMYILDEVPGWLPPARSIKRVRSKPKRYLADPSLAVAALGMSPNALIADWQTFGLIFENLCIRDLMVYASDLEGIADIPVRYYRDDSGLEADAIVELSDGRWAAFEIKTSEARARDGIESLRKLKRKLTDNAAARVRPPEFMAVITGVSEYARQVEDGLYVIPIRALCA